MKKKAPEVLPVKPVPEGLTIDELLRLFKGEKVQVSIKFPK